MQSKIFVHTDKTIVPLIWASWLWSSPSCLCCLLSSPGFAAVFVQHLPVSETLPQAPLCYSVHPTPQWAPGPSDSAHRSAAELGQGGWEGPSGGWGSGQRPESLTLVSPGKRVFPSQASPVKSQCWHSVKQFIWHTVHLWGLIVYTTLPFLHIQLI